MSLTVSHPPPDVQPFIERALATGQYVSAEELVWDAVRLLRDRDQKLLRLRELVAEADRAASEGREVVLHGEAELHGFFDNLRREGGLLDDEPRE